MSQGRSFLLNLSKSPLEELTIFKDTIRPPRTDPHTRTNQGQLVVRKARRFPDARCCSRGRAHAEHDRYGAATRVRGGIAGAAAGGRRAAPGSAWP